MKRCAAMCLLSAILLCGCAFSGNPGTSGNPDSGYTQFERAEYTLFDTVTEIRGFAEDEESFRKETDVLLNELKEYHELFDIYHEYDGVTNLKTINDRAGKEAVQADARLIAFLLYCKDIYGMTKGRVDVTLGPVIALWEEERIHALAHPEEAGVPEEAALLEAQRHTGWEHVRIDEEAGTVFLTDEKASLNAGALAKGYAVSRVMERAPDGYLINVGGNVAVSGEKKTGEAWVIGIRDPDGDRNGFLRTVEIRSGAVVSSGDYERYYMVNDTRYHHIIDPETLYPGTIWRGVSVICEDADKADALSTAVFLMSPGEAEALLAQTGAEAVMIDAEGELFYTEGFPLFLKK